MSYELYIVQPGNYTRKSKIEHVIEIKWTDDLDKIFLTFSFSSTVELEVGTWVELYNKYDEETVFIGIITKKEQESEFKYSYSGYDLGFYCEKNITTKQYKQETKIIDAIIQVCSDVSIPCGEFNSVNYTVKKTYKKETISNILKSLLEISFEKGQRKNIFFDCKNGKLNLFAYTENENLKGYIANIFALLSTDTIHSFKISSSIENMKNKIKVEDDKLTKEYTSPDNKESKKYGILQETIETSADFKDYKSLADNKLKELNKITNTLALTVLGNSKMKKGVIIPIKKEKINVDDKYLIITSNHTITGSKEIVEINLEKYIG